MNRVDGTIRQDDPQSGSRGDQAVVIALGSNLPGSFATTGDLLEAAIARLSGLGVNILARSRWWRSAAWPDPTLPDYLNGIVLVETVLSPPSLMRVLLDVEREFGRLRGDANAPRTLDLDLVAFGRQVSSDPGLILPHPRAAHRRFVMSPLAELLPHWTHPVTGQTAADLANSAPIGRDATPRDHA